IGGFGRHERNDGVVGQHRRLRSIVHFESIAYSRNGKQVPRLRWLLLELVEKLLSVKPQVLDLAKVARTKELAQELIVGHDLASLANHGEEQLVFGGGEVDLGVGDEHATLARIDAQVAHDERLGELFRTAERSNRHADPREKLAVTER